MDDWRDHAQTLAEAATHPQSRWRPVVAAIPRHVFIPHWFEPADGGWAAHDGQANPKEWARVAYRDRSVVTRIGARHSDETEPSAKVRGQPTSSATLPSLLLKLYRHAMLGDGLDTSTPGPAPATARPCSRRGSGIGCYPATSTAIWSRSPRCGVARPVFRSAPRRST